MRYLTRLITTLCLFFAHSLSVHASSEFTTDFHSIYSVQESGKTKVLHSIAITNNLAHIYTTEYTVSLGSGEIHDIEVTDGSAELPTTIDAEGNATTIKVALANPQVGQGKVNIIKISYTTSEIATRIGGNWEVNIPRVAHANEYREYRRDVEVPRGIGSATYVFPDPTHVEKGDITTYTYLGHPTDSLSLLFGESQTYELELRYTIQNPGLTQADTEIALPPDTEYQKVILREMIPEPKQINLDPDGNWMAVYLLKSQETKDIAVKMYVTVYPIPRNDTPLHSSPSLDSDPNWQIQDSRVKDLSVQLGEVSRIYEYLVDNFFYDYARIGQARLGASSALTSPESATCTEFTDSFVALSRSLGNRAREINGYAYGSNTTVRPQGEDILHAWPQYFDENKKQWIQVDPTWGNTTGGINYFDKLDYSHIAFVIHGVESTYPLPAGAYKRSNEGSVIKVTPVEKVPDVTPHPLSPTVKVGGGVESPPVSLWDRVLAFIRSLF